MANPEELKLALKLVQEAAAVQVPDDVFDAAVDGEDAVLDVPLPDTFWSQAQWVTVARLPEGFCVTGGCLAGHVAMHAGYVEPVLNRFGTVDGIRNPETGDTLTFSGPGSVAWFAMHKLGLTEEQADRLFDEHNTLEDLESYVKEFCDAER